MPNMWDDNGKPCYDPEPGWKIEPEEPKQQWDYDPRIKGYRGSYPTAADDFAEPYTPTIEEELEALI